MYIKRIVSAALSVIFAGTSLTSCSERGVMEMPFVEDNKREYSSVVGNSALTIYVDSKAKENGDGSEASPFKSIAEAQAKIREIKAGEGLPTGGITVLVKDGEYTISEGLVFTADDSGTAEAPITYVSESEFGAKITGALLLSADDFEPINAEETARLMDKTAADKIVKVDLAKYGLTAEDWGEYVVSGSHHTGKLYDEFAEAYAAAVQSVTGSVADVPVVPEAEVFIGDRALQCARYPNEGFISMKTLISSGGNSSERNPKGPTIGINSSLSERISQWSTQEDVWTFGYLSATWADSRNKVVSFDLENNSMELKYLETYLNSPDGRKWYFFNVFDELDADGEFYIDREKGILYIYKTADFYSERIKLSTLPDDIITLNNASYITFKGFYISETRANAIMGTGENVVVDNCKICNIRSGAVRILGNRNKVQNCEICNMGTFGVFLEGGNTQTLESSENVVYNNYIHDWSRVVTTYRTGIQVEGVGALVANNELCNSPHQAITWHGPYHTIEYNEVYNVCTETSDCGAIYSGLNYTSYGCSIRYNYVHDIGGGEVMAHGIYLDDGLSGQTVYGNIIVNSASSAFLFGGGRDNVIENNILINPGSRPIHYDSRYRDCIVSVGWVNPAEVARVNVPLAENQKLTEWKKAFSIYSSIIPYTNDFSGDCDDPNFSANPANNTVKNNITYFLIDNAGKVDSNIYKHNIAEDVYRFSEVENNPVIIASISDFPGWHNEDYTMKEEALGLEHCPEFKPIPFDKIGRVE